ncbi:MAG: hypothetical protein R3E02_00610 [Blastomonas sp.]
MTGSAMAQSMVVRSTGPSASQYPAGKKLPANAKISLKSGDRVTVLDKNGTRVLAGPKDYTLDGAVSRDGTASTQIAGLLQSSGTRRQRTGATRSAASGTPASTRSPNLWYVDVTRSGKHCVASSDKLIVWRPSMDADMVAQLGNGSGATATLGFRRDSHLALWPDADVPVMTGHSYNITNSDDIVTTVDLVVLPATSDDAEQVADMLIANGCTNQLDLMVDTLVSVAAIEESAGG